MQTVSRLAGCSGTELQRFATLCVMCKVRGEMACRFAASSGS